MYRSIINQLDISELQVCSPMNGFIWSVTEDILLKWRISLVCYCDSVPSIVKVRNCLQIKILSTFLVASKTKSKQTLTVNNYIQQYCDIPIYLAQIHLLNYIN